MAAKAPSKQQYTIAPFGRRFKIDMLGDHGTASYIRSRGQIQALATALKRASVADEQPYRGIRSGDWHLLPAPVAGQWEFFIRNSTWSTSLILNTQSAVALLVAIDGAMKMSKDMRKGAAA